MDIGKRITDICNEKNISVKDLAQRSGVSEATIKKIKAGDICNPMVLTVLHICDGLGVAYSEFFKGM